MNGLAFDVAHLLAGSLVLVSFHDALPRTACMRCSTSFGACRVLALSVRLAAFIQERRILPHGADRARIQGNHHSGGASIGSSSDSGFTANRDRGRCRPDHDRGIAWWALSMVVMLRVTPGADALAREDLAFALSVVLLGLLTW